MNGILKALKAIVSWLDKHRIPYMVIGGMARSLYGIPRQTFDVDVKIVFETDEDAERFVHEIPKTWYPVPEDPVQFMKETLVLPVKAGGITVNFVRAMLPYEKEAVERSLVKAVGRTKIQVVTPEDLIVQKAVSTRLKDWSDIVDIVRKFGKELDWELIVIHASDLSKHLDRPEILKRIIRLRDGSRVP